MGHTLNAEMRHCIDHCLDCYKACKEMIAHCLEKGGEHANPEHIRTLEECASLCKGAAELMLIGSPLHQDLCGLCAKACESCAVSCEQFEDEHMKQCAEVCRTCAESCQKMAQ